MRHLVIDQWNQRPGPMHDRGARAKLLSLFIFLLTLALTNPLTTGAALAYLAFWIAGLLWSRLPIVGVLRRIVMVLPFSLTFALFTWVMGEPHRAVQLVIKSSLSVGMVLLVIGTTTLPDLLRAAESFGAPRFLVLTIQSVYRYLFVLADRAVTMRWAAASRSHDRAARRQLLGAAAGTITVLFACAHDRASAIERSMRARGFRGRMPTLRHARWQLADTVLVCATAVAGGGAWLWAR